MVTISPFDLQNVALHYKWHKDKEVNYHNSQYLLPHMGSFNSFLKQVKSVLADRNNQGELYEIYLAENKKMIGMVEIYSINYQTHSCFVNCIIGNSNYIDKKYECEALHKTLSYCFKKLKMKKVCTIASGFNTQWINEMRKIGFKQEEPQPKQAFQQEDFCNKLILSLIVEEYNQRPQNSKLRAVN